MTKGKCKCSGFCPISLGLALGITCALAMLAMTIWIMYYGMPPMMQGMPMPTWGDAGIQALQGLWKGFLFGLVLGLVYDFIICIGSKFCSKKSGGMCGCGCTCCSKK